MESGCQGAAAKCHLGPTSWSSLRSLLDIGRVQGVGATPGCVRRRGRLAEMHLEQGNVDQAERLLRAILAYVESTQARRACCGAAADAPRLTLARAKEMHGRSASNFEADNSFCFRRVSRCGHGGMAAA